MSFRALAGAAICCAVCGSVASVADAANIPIGLYRLHDHPDGNAAPPLYGAKLNDLYDVTADVDTFTFDFDHAGMAMYMDYTGSVLHIYGTAFGGRDVGSDFANDKYRGVYTFDFVYKFGVTHAPGDDDLLVDLPLSKYNYGHVVTPLGDTILLRDGHYSDGQPDFRFGDEDNDQGHRGFAGLSGWGWIFHARPGQDYTYVQDSDWLFTGALIPTPGAISLAGGAGVIALRRARRAQA